MLGSRLRRKSLRRPRRRTLVFLVLLAAAIAATLLREPGDEPVIEGRARIVDGDSVEIRGAAIRLKGIDAPELAQVCRRAGEAYPCGQEARRHLTRLIAGEPLRCAVSGRDRYRRRLATCTAEGRDLNAAMVEDGWAVGYRGYDAAERLARNARRGLWEGTFERPQDWRRAQAASMAGGVDGDEDD